MTKKASRTQKLKSRSSVRNLRDFMHLVKYVDRPNLVAEGDSWFAYPRKGLIVGPATNIIDHIQKWASGKANILRLASNGDEATAMLSGRQRHTMSELLSKCEKLGRPVNAILFSAGGNDVVGRWDIARFLYDYDPNKTPEQHLNRARLKMKLQQIELAYIELCTLCEEYSPTTRIVAHTYDLIYPSNRGFRLFGKIPIGTAWLRHFMEKRKNIDDHVLQKAIVDILMTRLKECLTNLSGDPRTGGRLRVVNTQGTLPDKKWWQNEIHPTAKGFEKVARKIYDELRQEVPGLPRRR